MSIIAIRRNLSPGAVFFRQRGNIVEYSLDRETWEIAFLLPSERRTVNPSQFEAIDAMTIEEFLTINNYTYNNAITVANIDAIAATQGQIRRNLCTASTLLAAAFVHMLNAVKEETGDAETRFLGAGSALAGGALGLFLLLTPAGWIGAGVASILGLISAGLGLGGAAAAFVAEADNVPNLEQDDMELILCYLLRAASASAADKDAMRDALSQTYDDLSPLPVGVEDAWVELWDISPTLYSVWLAGLTDLEASTCNCGGCVDIIPWECTVTAGAGYKTLEGFIKTTFDNSAYGGNFKGMTITFPNVEIGAQIDEIALNFVTTEYQKSSALGWSITPIEITLGAAGGSPVTASKTITEVSPNIISTTRRAGGVQRFIFDLTASTLTGGSNGNLAIVKRTAYATAGIGADSIFTGGTICYRSP